MEGDGAVSLEPYRRTAYFNPLPPHGGRRGGLMTMAIDFKFQSTPSAWRETPMSNIQFSKQVISIHSLRMEGDPILLYTSWVARYFNPLPPHGGRLIPTVKRIPHSTFQSTPSAWRETVHLDIYRSVVDISIHSLRMEGDSLGGCARSIRKYFNPLPPHGGRLYRLP